MLWKLSLAITTIVSIFLMWQCGSALRHGQQLANAEVRHFHQKLNSGHYEEICREADEDLAGDGKHDEFVKFLEAVHTKMGDAGPESLVNIRVNPTTGGSFITTQYNTIFGRGTGIETFVWIRTHGSLKLYEYNIQSNALVLN
jgi:hypothetical protein